MADGELKTFIGRGGQLRYVCPECSFDHYNEDTVYGHWQEMHIPKGTKNADSIVLFDADEKPIRKEIVLPEGFKHLL